jgi:uncharacterized protein YbjT (DUF2867 family)
LRIFATSKNSNMKIVITGSLGNISKPLTKELVQKGHSVTVISTKPEKQKDIEALGARAAIGSIEDVTFLKASFAGADAVYTMIPPPNFFDPGIDPTFDMMAHCVMVTNNYAEAIRESGVKRVVHLSSIGAHLDKGTGLILLHHAVESILNGLSDVAITFMRPVAFYYNLYGFLGSIKKTGAIASNYGAEDRLGWVSPIDIAAAIAEEIVIPPEEIVTPAEGIVIPAEEIVKPPVGRKVLYVASEELTCNEIAGILGAAIGKPDLKWIVITDEQMRRHLESVGTPPFIAAGLVEMNASMHRGELFQDYYSNGTKVMGKVKLRDFAKEFAAAYEKQ